MFRNRALITVLTVLLLCVGLIQPAVAVQGPFIFDWGVRDNILLGFEDIAPVPHPGHDWLASHQNYVNLYNQLYAADRPLCLMLQSDTNPIDGTTDMYALSTVMGYIPRLNIAFADFEGASQNAETLEMISQIRSNTNPDINSAYVCNYADYPGTPDNSTELGPSGANRSAKSTFYSTSGTNVANPNCYPYESFETHTWASYWGATVSPSKRSALFWAPLERFCVAKRNLPSGHLLIPWTARFISYNNYTAPVPTREDVRALIQHMRLRGADGYYRLGGTFSDAGTTVPAEDTENRMDMLNAWRSLDKVFAGAGAVTILNLNTNKTGGLEWSGVQHGSKVAILISNLGNSAASIDLPPGYGLPANSDVIAAGQHQLKIYTTILLSDDACAKTNGTLTTALYTSYNAGSTDVANYLKFNLASIAPPAGFRTALYSAKLVTNAPARVGAAYTDALFSVTDNSWTEAGLTWANKPATVSQLSSWITAASPVTIANNTTALTAFVEHQANNSDANASFCIKDIDASKTSAQYQQYYDSDVDTTNCFKLVVEYTQQISSSTLPQTAAIQMASGATVGPGGVKSTVDFAVGYFDSQGQVPTQTFLKYDLSSITIPAGQTIVVTSANIATSVNSGNLWGDPFTQYVYGVSNDNWNTAGVNWDNKPVAGVSLDSGITPGPWAAAVLFESASLTAFVQQEVSGDKIVSVMVDGNGAPYVDGRDPCKWYYGTGSLAASPILNIVYHLELLGPPADCTEVKTQGYGLKTDFSGDCRVNFEDFAIMAERWLK